jgi:hypothetical protein
MSLYTIWNTANYDSFLIYNKLKFNISYKSFLKKERIFI